MVQLKILYCLNFNLSALTSCCIARWKACDAPLFLNKNTATYSAFQTQHSHLGKKRSPLRSRKYVHWGFLPTSLLTIKTRVGNFYPTVIFADLIPYCSSFPQTGMPLIQTPGWYFPNGTLSNYFSIQEFVPNLIRYQILYKSCP